MHLSWPDELLAEFIAMVADVDVPSAAEFVRIPNSIAISSQNICSQGTLNSDSTDGDVLHISSTLPIDIPTTDVAAILHTNAPYEQNYS